MLSLLRSCVQLIQELPLMAKGRQYPPIGFNEHIRVAVSRLKLYSLWFGRITRAGLAAIV